MNLKKGGIKTKMKILNNKKALSPVVASIILIAVTVAVSIAVAAWMGALTFTFTRTEELKITGVIWQSGTTKYVNISVSNTGASTLTLSKAFVDNVEYTYTTYGSFSTNDLAKGTSGVVRIQFAWTSGTKYTLALLTTNGNKYEYTATAVP